MVVQVDNPANVNMHYGEYVPIKGIMAPDYLPKKVLYSDREATRIFKEMNNDIYEDSQKAKPYHKTGFPTILKILLGGLGIASVALFGKNIAKFIKNILKKH